METLSMKYFDALEYVKQSRKLGASEELAEFQAKQIEHAIENAILLVKEDIRKDNLATKQDVTLVNTDIALLNANLRETEFRLKNELIRWILGTCVATILALAGLLKLVH